MYFYTKKDILYLENKANDIREDVIEMIGKAKAGHPGGSLSCVDIVTALYFRVMNVDSENPGWEDRDRFVISKGHSCPAVYAALAEKGFFDKKELGTLRQYHSILQGHPDMNKTPGIDMTSGSLGNGFSAAVGIAMSARVQKRNYEVYVLLGDGETQEGIVWEAAMAAAHHHLNNLTAIVDYNGLQINGWVNDVMRIDPVADKWKAFGWSVIEVNGHDMQELLDAFHHAKKECGPTVLIAHTVKGKGISFMEDRAEWHGKAPDAEQIQRALLELRERGNGYGDCR